MVVGRILYYYNLYGKPEAVGYLQSGACAVAVMFTQLGGVSVDHSCCRPPWPGADQGVSRA